MQKWYDFALLCRFQDMSYQKALNVDSATNEILWNDPSVEMVRRRATHEKLTITGYGIRSFPLYSRFATLQFSRFATF